MKIHRKYMSRCIEIAKNGLGTVAPNPMVGCVIVFNDKIIGEGFTSPYGQNHAEVNAINSVKEKNLLSKSTLYVTLEPCSHYGKTPPCADLIIEHRIPNVIVGTLDSNKLVSGQGIEKLVKTGCEVKIGVLEKECREHHKRFFTFHEKKRPYVILKWAQTLDGFIAPKTRNDRKPVWISNQYSRQLTHKWRTEEQAILVGTNTVIEDNPSLTSRDYKGHNPIRIFLDRTAKTPRNSQVYNNDAKTIVITSEDQSKNFDTNKNLRIHTIDWTDDLSIAKQICECLHIYQISSVLIEGGTHTLQTFIDENIWDEARVFEGCTILNEGIKAPELKATLFSSQKIDNNKLRIYTNN